MYPSIITHTLNGIFLILSFLFVIIYFSKLQNFDTYRILVLSLLVSLVFGVHGISHLGLEREYGYSPYSIFSIPKPNSFANTRCPCMLNKTTCPCTARYKIQDHSLEFYI